MQTRLRFAIFASLAVIALAVVFGVAGSREDDSASTIGIVPGTEPAIDGEEPDVLSQVDKAIGRLASAPEDRDVANPAAQESFAKDSAGASAGGRGSTAIAPAQPPVGGIPMTNASIDDRKIVQTASLKLQVNDVAESFGDVGRIATSAGGFIAASNFALSGDQNVASVTIRVPATRYQDVLGELRSLGAKIDSEASNASDVTEEYSDLTARLNNLNATEQQYLTLLGRSQSINEILLVQDRLSGVRGQIEQVKGRMQLLDKLTDLATIGVFLRPVAVPANAGGGFNFNHEVSQAWDESMQFLGDIAGAVVTVVVFAWWLPFVAVPVAVYALRRRAHATPAQVLD